MRGISKSFGKVKALTGVDLVIRPGEIHALVGENGSGKSTLLKILAGQLKPDTGGISVDGQTIRLGDPRRHLLAGIGVVFQNAQVCDTLKLDENLFLGRLPTRWGFVDWRALRRASTDVLTAAGLPLEPGIPVGLLSGESRQLTEVARVLARDCSIVALDETTAAMTPDRVEQLFASMREVRDRGGSVIFVSHRLEETFALADRITVLRDGASVATLAARETDADELIRLMVGRPLEDAAPRTRTPTADTLLSIRGLTAGAIRTPIDLDVRAGEIVGVAGLTGSGRTSLLEGIFGARRREGEVRVGGEAVAPSPRSSIRAGIGFVPADRRAHGLALARSVRFNASLVLLGTRRLLSRPSAAAERGVVALLFGRLGLKARDEWTEVRTLSGGNQQKVVLGRWLARNSDILLMDEPTRAIDERTKRQIYDAITGLADEGKSILVSSSELPELIGLCDRILVLHEGMLVKEVARGASQEDIARAMVAFNAPIDALDPRVADAPPERG
ncbi:sugar ABC transporter ATP-binding protein [Microbacterium sp. ARD31]|uniref:sugar ABC transporter ATP-binding protein n=1 Tax=Microbacterium sp. ARD31 TaxID=2962576 RepID=UPI00288117F7|nr:sugar ABC transporter ATP-binding protein [Microbacterium sp. ARD31]MDT0184000.1 sugar ABC transporter ATP-binding protein [Microbacterium sp. ARD31]